MDFFVPKVPVVEDEGYTSPMEEDFKYNPVPYGTDIQQYQQVPPLEEQDVSFQEPSDEDAIPWEEIAKLPYVPNRHLTWDNLQAPIPFRFQPGHPTLGKKQPVGPYLTDCLIKSREMVDCIWRIPRVQEDSNGTIIPKDFSPSVQELMDSLEKPIYISLKQFIQYAFHLLSGRESLAFLYDDKTKQGKFRKNPVVLVSGISPTALSHYCQSLLRCGSIVRRLNRYSSLHYDNKLLKEKGLERSAVATSFFRYIADFLKLYQTILMLNSSTICTLTSLIMFIKPFKHQLETLTHILDNNLSVNAVELLSSLNLMLFLNETPFISDLIRGLFIACSSAYLKYVSDWIFRGILGPPSEFHIEKLRCTPYKDRRYWTKQFSHKNSVPMFLEESVDLIFETGKAISLLNQIQNENIFASIPLFCYDTDVLLTFQLEFENVSKLHAVWNLKLTEFLKVQSYLTDGISLSIEQVLTCQEQGIDFEAIEKAKLERESILLTRKLSKYQFQKTKKKEFLEVLQEQVQQTKELKLKEVQNSKLEDEKNKDYWIMKDNRDLTEEKRHRMKHFGDDNIASTSCKGLLSRLHSAPAGIGTNSETDHVSEIEDIDALVSESNHSIGMEIIPPYVHQRACKIDDIADQVEKIEVNVEEEKSEVESFDITDELNVEDFNDDKFDPEKVKTKSPPPYRTCISLDSTFSQISSLEFSSSEGDERLETSEELLMSSRYDPFCLNEFLSQSIAIPLKAQNRMVNAAVLHYFVCEKNLFFHLEALNNFMCLQNGLFGHVLSTLLIQEVNRKNMRTGEDVINKSGRLNMILAEALSTAVENQEHNEFIGNLGFTINKNVQKQLGDVKFVTSPSAEKEKSISSDYQILDTVRLCYSVEWPLNILLTDDLLHHYEKLFIFLMQLFRAELLLQQAYTMLKCKKAKSPQLFTLHQYRYRLLHFVTTVRNYVNVTVIHTAWNELCSSFTKMDSLDKIYEYLVRHIKTVNTNCLLGVKAEGVMKLLTNQLVIIETFCSQLQRVTSNVNWANGEEIPAKDFKKLVQRFKAVEEIGKVFTVVAYKLVNKGYYPKVSYFLELYNFNGYFQMKDTSG